MSAIEFPVKVIEAKLGTINPALGRIELRRCNADGSDAAVLGVLALDVPTCQLHDFVPGSLASVSIHPLKAQVK